MKVTHRYNGTLALLFGCAALALVAPSCGGDDDDSASTGGKGGAAGGGGKAATTGGVSLVTGGTAGKGGAGTGGSAGAAKGGSAGTGGTVTTGGQPDGGVGGWPDGGVGGVPDTTGGVPSTGGTGTGGATGGTAGVTGTGGTAGVTGTGGTAGAGGEPDTGGAGGVDTGGAGGGDDVGGAGGNGPAEPCVTAFTGGTVLFSFEPTSSLAGWQGGPAGNVTDPSTVVRNTTEGHSCAGALQLSVPFQTYSDDRGQVSINNRVWTGTTALHVWVKVLDPGTGNLDHLQAIQLFLQTGNYSASRYPYIDAGVFEDFAWHEVVIPFAAITGPSPEPALVPGDIDSFGAWVTSKTAAPTGGPANPVPTTILIDDIWIE